MSVKIVIILNKDNIFGRLTKFFTGCPAYHIGFLDEASNRFYDMNLLFRRRIWPVYVGDQYEMYDCPISLSAADLERQLETDWDYYGVLDYLFFGLRKIPQFFGFTVKNYKGSICSEKVNQILIDHGWDSPWGLHDMPPSPCDWRTYLIASKTSV
jgi:hypothetical protein